MKQLRPRESFYLVAIGTLIVLFGVCTVFTGVLTMIMLTGGGAASTTWRDVAGGVAFTVGGALLTWGSIRLYRFVERRGLVDPPGT